MATQRAPESAFDRVPPQNLDAERSVLGAMLLNTEAVGVAIEVLRDEASEIFYSAAHQHIYSAIVNLFRDTMPVDAVILRECLNREDHFEAAGGPAYIAELSGSVPTSANVEYYAKTVLDAAVLRRLISSCTALVTDNGFEVWAPTQAPERAINTAAKRAKLPVGKGELHVTQIGGGFGRRLYSDFVAQAVQIAKAMKGTPVKLVWSREETMQHSFYRPANLSRFRGALDSQGHISGSTAGYLSDKCMMSAAYSNASLRLTRGFVRMISSRIPKSSCWRFESKLMPASRFWIFSSTRRIVVPISSLSSLTR